MSEAPDERVRLFVALELPEAVVTTLVRWRDEVIGREGGLRAVPPASLHVTLCFLGWRFAHELDDIVAACGAVGSLPAASLTVDGAIWLPPRRPHVLAVDLGDEDGRLAAVQRALSEALAAGEWYAPETRPFLAHVTVARVARGARVRPRELTAPSVPPFPGTHVTVFRSRLSPAGARYERLASIELRYCPGVRAASARARTATSGDPRPST